MVLIFEDSGLKSPIKDYVLFEGQTYWLTLPSYNEAIILNELETSKIGRFLNWHPKNKVGTLRLSEVVGFINLFGEKFDVRSPKLLSSETGENQFQILLNEIADLSSDIIFSSPSSAELPYELDKPELTTSIYYKFMYFKNVFFNSPKRLRPDFQLEEIFRDPHFTQTKTFQNIDAANLRYINSQTINKIPAQPSFLYPISPQQNLYKSPLAKYLGGPQEGQRFFPRKLYSLGNEITFDTNENRFVKFFYQQIEVLCHIVLQRFSDNKSVRSDAKRLIREVKKKLNHPFFRNIGSFSFLPTTSSVLHNRSGYRDLYQHYLQCRRNPQNIFYHIENIFLFLDIKNIALLYEYWVFLKFVTELFGKELVVDHIGTIIEGNSIKLGCCVKKDNISVYYNKTYSKRDTETYCLNFIPDIVLEVENIEGLHQRFIFDAKYKMRKLYEDPEEDFITSKTFKHEDVVKMLSYLEAIKDVDAAFIIYPGDKFRFYEKTYNTINNVYEEVGDLKTLSGVGALPLSPGSDPTELMLKRLSEIIKSQFLESS